MTIFLQACGGVLITVILVLTLGNREKEMAGLLALTVCCFLAILSLNYLKPVIDLISQLESIGNLDASMVETLLKIAGIGLVSEIAALVCSDSGNAALGKSLQLLAGAVILWLSVPLFTALMELIQKILGEA